MSSIETGLGCMTCFKPIVLRPGDVQLDSCAPRTLSLGSPNVGRRYADTALHSVQMTHSLAIHGTTTLCSTLQRIRKLTMLSTSCATARD